MNFLNLFNYGQYSWDSPRRQILNGVTSTINARSCAPLDQFRTSSNGQINVKGVFRPTIAEIYTLILNKLAELKIKMVEEYGLPLSENINI